MAELFFPQLSVGAVAQYPIRKTRTYRTITNTLADGRLILYPDPSARRVQWELTYANLTIDDIQALQNHYRLCNGQLQTFTFLDPTGNLFTQSEALSKSPWLQQSQISVNLAGNDAPIPQTTFTLTNGGQASADLYQSFTLPANYVYSLSLYVRTSQPSQIGLFRRGSSVQESKQFVCGSSWQRVCLSGALPDRSLTLDAGITLSAGQQIEVCGLQFEPQVAPSDYRPTGSHSGLYPTARYGMNEMLISADAPGLYSTALLVESPE